MNPLNGKQGIIRHVAPYLEIQSLQGDMSIVQFGDMYIITQFLHAFASNR
jgi:hypothetical protein